MPFPTFVFNSLKKVPARHLLGLTLLFTPFLTIAQKSPVKNDTSKIEPRYPDPKLFQELKSDSDYNYETDPPPSDNLISKWWNWFWQQFSDFLESDSYNSFWQYVLIPIMAGVVLFLLYKAKILNYVFPPKTELVDMEYRVGKENIHEINFDDAIAQAFSVGDFRLAIRLQYLKTLKVMTDRNLIQWHPHRTNQSYVLELAKSPFQNDFEKITRHFEFAWYGAFTIREEEFKEMKDWSNSFYQKIQQS